MDSSPLILLAAGGTGGHLFPAEALGVELIRRGFRVRLATDARALRYSGLFSKDTIDVVPSATVRGRDPLSLARTGMMLGRRHRGVAQSDAALEARGRGRLRRLSDRAAAAGGQAARRAGIIHDANAVLGRANRFLSRRVTAIATSLPGVLDRDPELAARRPPSARRCGPQSWPQPQWRIRRPEIAGPFRLLVTGGSQGARVMSDIVPRRDRAARACTPSRLVLTQQVRQEDMARVREIYDRLKINAELAPFFTDLPARLAANHLVISRSGAGTVAELAAIGRPSILVPLPGAIDQDQFANAGVLSRVDGALRIAQSDFTSARLAAEISAFAAEPSHLAAMAAGACSIGRLDAAERLADLVTKTAGI